MSWRTHWIVLRLRSLGRRLRLNHIAARLFYPKNYEEQFKKLMLCQIRPGDCIWDIGANIGLYTKQFSDLVGERGSVFAFEPSPINLEELKKAVRDRRNVVVFPLALGDREAMMRFQQGADTSGATSKVLDDQESEAEKGIEVEMVRGDELIHSGRALLPNMIKIDTEGFELDVIEGMLDSLCNSGLRTVCIEVHFGLLDRRGLQDASKRIENHLETAGFLFKWSDASHIVATRRTQ